MKHLNVAVRGGLFISCAVCLYNCGKELPASAKQMQLFVTKNEAALPVTTALPHPDHIIFVWLENKGYNKIIGSPHARFINSLVSKGTLFTNTYALVHPSYPNYIAFFSGSTQGVISDNCIYGAPFSQPNLYTVLKAAGKTFAWYSEGLPHKGSDKCSSGYYREKHNPTTIFSNVPAEANKTFASLPKDYTQLENVVCISPNMINDMHDGSIGRADAWLRTHLSALATWCLTHNSIFVIYFDEDDHWEKNRIPVIAVGEPIKPAYQLSTKYDHYNWTKTVCTMFDASGEWNSNLTSRNIITGCWK